MNAGDVWESAGRTVTEADIMSFAGVSGDFNALHTDEEWVREHTPFSGRIAHGLLTLAITSGLRTPGLDDLEVLAYLEVARQMVGPVYPGDTIRATHTVSEVRPSASRPGTGVVKVGVEVRNQRGEVVQRGADTYLVTL
jgi:3-hydroxybutyryl-CoA dehydratase